MKRKIIIASMIVLNIMTVALTGCGNNQTIDLNEGPAVPADDHAAEYAPLAKAGYEEEITTVDKETITDEDIEKILEESSDEEIADAVKNGEITEPVESTVEKDDIEGLIVLNVLPRQYFTDDDVAYDIYIVQSINPNSGYVKEISHFCVISSFIGQVQIPKSAIYARVDHLCLRSLFSLEYDKMAVEQFISESKVYNTGWIDLNGNFTDVAAKTGNASTDFNIRSFKTLGFMPDGTFTYRERGDNSIGVLYPVYSTDSETLSMAVEEDPWTKFYMCNQNYTVMGHEGQDESILWFRDYTLTDWINDTECIADKGILNDSVIVNTQTQEVIKYIPDTNTERYNWSGVASPDGSKIAFLSMTTRGTDAPYIYVVPREGGEPVKISCDINFDRTSAAMCGILEWK